jgi:AcrR family transcriptional regulator
VAAAPARMSAEERREQVLEAALSAFAATGYHGTKTEAIARDAGISHAYLFRLFGTKKELFLACGQRCQQATLETFRAAAAEAGGGFDALAAMGSAYRGMLSDRRLLQMQMQLWAACSDDEIRACASAHYEEVVREIERLSGADADVVRTFIAHGMLLNVAAALDLESQRGKSWVRRLLGMEPRA